MKLEKSLSQEIKTKKVYQEFFEHIVKKPETTFFELSVGDEILLKLFYSVGEKISAITTVLHNIETNEIQHFMVNSFLENMVETHLLPVVL